MSSLVFLTECADIGEAQVVKSFLEAQGFHPRVRDEYTRTVAPHMQNLLGKLVIDIPEFEFAEASQALENLEIPKPLHLVQAEEEEANLREEQLRSTQSLAKKSLINAVLGCVFIPILCNIYSLVLAYRVVQTEKPLTKVSGQRILLALLFNGLGIYVWATFGAKFYLKNL